MITIACPGMSVCTCNEAYEYMFIVLLGSGATFFYNMISNILRALGDSRTPLYYLVFSSLLNIVLDIPFIVPFKGGVAGAAWATVLSQLLASLLCAVSGVRRYEELRLSRRDFSGLRKVCIRELKIGFPMGFQMSVMCIGQLAMQSAVNGFGSMAVAGYTAATKADQVSVLVNNATASALSAYVSQNYGAGKWKRIRQRVHAALIQTQCLNLMMGVGILLLRRPIVEMFLANPPKEVIWYSNGYLNWVAPCYLILDCFYQLLLENKNKFKNHCPSSQEALRRLRIMLDYIHEHFNQPFSLTGLANHTLLSRESCCRIFKQMTGMTISQYMTEYRVMRSLPYLADGKYSIAEVSALCGFSSQSRFAAAFRSKMGCNPNQYLHSNFDIIRNS